MIELNVDLHFDKDLISSGSKDLVGNWLISYPQEWIQSSMYTNYYVSSRSLYQFSCSS